MTIPNRYLSRRFNDNGTELAISWLPGNCDTMLVCFTQEWEKKGLGHYISADNAANLASFLDAIRINAGGSSGLFRVTLDHELYLSITGANRGDPYREGIEISLQEDYRHMPSVFIEGDDIPDLIAIIRDGLPAGRDGQGDKASGTA